LYYVAAYDLGKLMERYSFNISLKNGTLICAPCWSWEVRINKESNSSRLTGFEVKPLDGFHLGWLPINEVTAIWIDCLGPLTEQEIEDLPDTAPLSNRKIYVD
jgi:hypothetical protein